MNSNYDFSGWATKNDIRCSDGRTIRHNAFIENDGMTVPLVWNHNHSDPSNVLGHALLENRADGVYAYCTLNDTEAGKNAREQVKHGDITALSIYANKLKQNGGDVIHGIIREVSLVLAGANPGAFIDSYMAHGEASDDDAVIYTDESIELFHAEEKEEKKEAEPEKKDEEPKNEKTIEGEFDSMTDSQKVAAFAVIGQMLNENANDKEDSEGGKEEMKHNVFENDQQNEEVIQHADFNEILADAKRCGSLAEAALAHSYDDEHPVYGTYGVGEHTDYLFPDAKNVTNSPQFIKRDTTWVGKLMNKTHHTPFSRIKSIFANITADEARARGYIRGKYKVEEVIALLKRTTDPQTIYKKQRMDRDDIIDITDFDVVAWIKGEMRGMLDEEIARAVLLGDGRLSSSDDKISPLHIRPIWTDDDLYTIKQTVKVPVGASADVKAKNFIRQAIKARKNYKGSGNPILFTTEDMLTDMLLLEDTTGRIIYESEAKLATTLRVSEIVTVEVMEGLQRQDSTGADLDLMGIIVNPADYNIGADKGGAVSMFDDFDIDYNQQKYLIETRCSGALIKPYAAIALECLESNS